jgi:tetratricopeptide (TPR) repeat protein
MAKTGSAGEGRKKFNEALLAGKKREYKKAVFILEELLSGFDAPAEAYLFLGRSLHALKDYSRALACYNDYIRLKPESYQGYLFAGRTYIALGIPQKALRFLEKALALRPDDPAIMALLGTAFLKARHSRQAVDMLRQAVETAPENKRIYRAYINALLIRGIRLCHNEEYDLGLQMLRFVLANGGVNTLLLLELGRACREQGFLREALKYYTRALKYTPRDLRIRWYRASILMALGESAKALNEINEIRAVDSGLPDLPWNSELVDHYIIRSFMEKGEWRQAGDACRLWIKHRGPNPMVHAMYAEVLRNLKNFPAALNHLSRALEMENENLKLWYARLLVGWEGENWKDLRRSLKAVKSLGGDGDIIKRFSVLLELKTTKDGDRKVIALLQNAIRSLGPEPEFMYALGERYLKVGLIEEALGWFRKTLKVRKDHERSRLGEIAALEALSAYLPSVEELARSIKAAKSSLPAVPGQGGGVDDSAGLLAAARQAQMKMAEKIARELRGAYDAYVKHWPDNFVMRREWALYLIHTFEYDEAIKELEALLPYEPSNPSLRRVLAYAYRKTGRYREAAVFLKSLLKGKPRDIELLLEFTGCLERAGASFYAKAVLEKAMGLLNQSSEVPMALGLFFYREQKLEKAYDLFREAAGRNTKDPRPYQWMAALARKNGDNAGAAKFDQEAQKRAKPAYPL